VLTQPFHNRINKRECFLRLVRACIGFVLPRKGRG
jgi:hypothetical protein